MTPIIKRLLLGLAAGVAVLAVLGLAAIVWQGRQPPRGDPQYVALGSSFAAGLGLGPAAPGSPFVCQRSVNGYPQRLARETGLSLVDMSCSGATAAQVVRGGQAFQGPQVAALGPATRLVTLTAGGNDIAYVGDLVSLGYANRGGLMGAIVKKLSPAPHAMADRHLDTVQDDLEAAFLAVRVRSPGAKVVVATYPPILPSTGTCAALGLSEAQVAVMRPVAARLAEVTRSAAQSGGAILVDMAILGKGHDACAAEPWTNGVAPSSGAPFHPTQAGAAAIARAIAAATGL